MTEPSMDDTIEFTSSNEETRDIKQENASESSDSSESTEYSEESVDEEIRVAREQVVDHWEPNHDGIYNARMVFKDGTYYRVNNNDPHYLAPMIDLTGSKPVDRLIMIFQ